MWKYVSRRIRDTFERSANYFDVRSSAGVANAPNNNYNGNEKKKSCPPSRWYCPRKCWNSSNGTNNTNNKRWNFEHLNSSWLGAITWSSGLVIGWYASQLIHLKHKYKRRDISRPVTNKYFYCLKPYLKSANKDRFLFQSAPQIEHAIQNFAPPVRFISNDHSGGNRRERVESGSSTSADSTGSDLGDVLNSIENRLGLSAIENGQHQDGLNLLRSAANRHHAPALYNLGLCYELGLGVKPDEKVAMELYRSAATLEHPAALYNLSIYYAQGRGGLTRDTETATRLLRLAAIKGQVDAVKALKTLDIPPTEDKKSTTESWNYSYVPYTQSENIVPMQSSLYVDNVNTFLNVHTVEATVY